MTDVVAEENDRVVLPRPVRPIARRGPFMTIFRHRKILLRTTLVDLKGLYAGSLLGIVWIGIGPLLLLCLYASIYLVIFRFRPTELTQVGYVLYIFSGLVPFLAFSSSLGSGAASLASNKQVLLNTVFPAELLPFRAVLVNSVSLLAGLVIVLVVDAALDQPSVWAMALPVLVVLQIMFTAGVIWVISLANLVVRDIQQSLTYVTLALLIATPIAYTPDMIPPTLQPLIWINPLAYYVICYQHVLVLNAMPPTWAMIAATIAALVSFTVGFRMFQHAKQVIFDYA